MKRWKLKEKKKKVIYLKKKKKKKKRKKGLKHLYWETRVSLLYIQWPNHCATKMPM